MGTEPTYNQLSIADCFQPLGSTKGEQSTGSSNREPGEDTSTDHHDDLIPDNDDTTSTKNDDDSSTSISTNYLPRSRFDVI